MFTKDHHHHIRKLVHIKNQLKELYIHLVIQAIAVSMISIYVPIYLLEFGYDMKTVILFLFVQWASFGLLAPFCGKLIEKIGIREVVMIRTPLFVLALILLSFQETLHSFFYGISFLLGFSSILYTLSICSLFAECLDKKILELKQVHFYLCRV